MEARVDPEMIATLAEVSPDPQAPPDRLSVLVPAFMLSEIQRAFEIGFLVSLPFLIIDLVVSAVLMSMGMMMVPPAVVALPFKLAFFVVVDGWGLIAVTTAGLPSQPTAVAAAPSRLSVVAAGGTLWQLTAGTWNTLVRGAGPLPGTEPFYPL